MNKTIQVEVNRLHPSYFKGLNNAEIGNIFYPIPVFYDGVRHEIVGCKNYDGVYADLTIREVNCDK